ncbi:remodeling and spacing factor 1-like [Entelurus aequoreus]|uniref:remodeling and spacing factor 1-like n=1 Tax=Entelurus aequoreus TaxID=161455 RepID=UPI002B1DBFC7|nr:remodeling and spacing factor 1-like [Entelurus aequoreus]
MAASAATASSPPGLCPNYAVICSFLERYGALLDLPELTFPQLERYLQDTSSVPKLLVDLHVKLLRKIGKSVSADRWEKYLVKVCQDFNTTWAWELEEKGYKDMTPKSKTAILKYLCECQFDDNLKFKNAINEEDPDKMRLQPIGRDKDGQMYWFQLDQDNNVRLYVEEQDDLDGSSWKCIVRDRNDLAQVLALLKTHIDPELLKNDAKSEEEKAGVVKKDGTSSDESSKAALPAPLKTESNGKVEQQDDVKSETCEVKSTLSDIAEVAMEKPVDESVDAKVKSIKEEPTDDVKSAAGDPTPLKSEPECAKSKVSEEANRNNADEIQQIKNEQQAKIPLKKRGMKFSEDFDKSFVHILPVSKPDASSKRGNDHVNGEVHPTPETRLQPPLSEELSEKQELASTKDVGKDTVKDPCCPAKVSPLPSDQKDSSVLVGTETTAAADEGGKKLSNQEELETEAKSLTENKMHSSKKHNSDHKVINKELEKPDHGNMTAAKEAKEPEMVESRADVKPTETNVMGKDARECDAGTQDNSIKKMSPEREEPDEKAHPKSAAKKKDDTTSREVAQSSSVIKKIDTSEKSSSEASVIKKADAVEPRRSAKKDMVAKTPEQPQVSEDKKDLSEKVEKALGPDTDKPQQDDEAKRTEEASDCQEKTSSNADKTATEPDANQEQALKDQPEKLEAKPLALKVTKDERQKDSKSDKTSEKDPPEKLKSGDHPVETEQSEDTSESKETSQPTEEAAKSEEDESKKEVTEKVTKDERQKDSKSDKTSEKDPPEKLKSGDHPVETEQSEDTSESKETSQPTEEAAKSEEDGSKKEVTENGDEARSNAKEKVVRRKGRTLAQRRKAKLQLEERRGDSGSDTNAGGRSLRRSPRISRSTLKAEEIQDTRPEKSQAETEKEDEEEEEEEEEEEQIVEKKPREKKVSQEGQSKPKARKRRKTRWSNVRTRHKRKGSGDEDDEDGDSDEESSEYVESEEDDSDEDYKVERSRRGPRRRYERRRSDSSTSSDDNLPPNEDPCKHCGLPNHPELILLCDSCDSGYHTACLRPPLMIIPDGEWFCSPCQHKKLCDQLEEQLLNLDAALKKKERADRRKERLIYVGISLENIITPAEKEDEKPEMIVKEKKKDSKRSKSWGRRSTRAKKSISYRFDEFDEAIEEAIEEDIKEAEGGGAGRGKDMANITGNRGKDMATIIQSEEAKENGQPPCPSAGQRKKKRRRLNDLDSDSTVDEEESEDEFCLSESSEEEFVVTDNEAEAETDADSNASSSGKRRTANSRSRNTLKRRRSSRKRRRPKGYSDDEEVETDEDVDEEEIATEGSSEYSDSDLDMSRRRSRRSRKAQVNYAETSESEGSQAETNRDKTKPRRRLNSSDSEASFSQDSEEGSKDQLAKKKGDSSEEESRQRRRRLALKRRRASEEEDSDNTSDESSEEDRPVRKRVNRIDSDDDEEEESEKPKEKNAAEEGAGVTAKGTNTSDSNAAEPTPTPPPPANGQTKSVEGVISRNGQEGAAQEEDEDDLLGVTDLVDYVCNNEDL